MAETPSRAQTKHETVVLTAGFSCIYALCVSFFYGAFLPSVSYECMIAFENSLNISMALGCVVLAVLAGRIVATKHLFKPVWLLGHALMLVAIVLMFPFDPFVEDVAFLSFAATCGGLGIAFAVPLYFACFAPFPRRRIAACCGFVFTVGMVVNIAMFYMPSKIAFVMHMLLIAGSVLCVAVFRPATLPVDDAQGCQAGQCASAALAPASAPQERSNASASGQVPLDEAHDVVGAYSSERKLTKTQIINTFLIPVAGTFALSVVYRVIDVAAVGLGQPLENAMVVSQLGGVLAALIFLAYFCRKAPGSMSLLFNGVFGVLATGLLFLPFLPYEYTAVMNTFAAAGWKLVMLALFFLSVITYAHSPKKMIQAIALAYALPRVGLLLGMIVALAFGVQLNPGFAGSATIVFFCLYLILLAIWVVSYHGRKTAESMAKEAEEHAHLAEEHAQRAEAQAQAAEEMLRKFMNQEAEAHVARCDALAQSHGLTEREKSILYLLAQGRDISYICGQLYLSKNTVKSYQKSIYAKLGVHSKQEIIGLAQQ